MTTRITVLIENRPGADSGLTAEHGLSILIERGNRRVLFDTGKSGSIVANAKRLGVRLDGLTDVVISHGHNDHANGLPALVNAGVRDFTLHVQESFFDRKYVTDRTGPDGGPEYAGASWDRAWCETKGIRLHQIRETITELSAGISIVGNFARTHPLETNNPRFLVKRTAGNAREIDDFRDEIALVIEGEVEGESALIMVVGCSHPGIMNMVDTVRQRFAQPIRALLGGTHLMEAQGPRLEQALTSLATPAAAGPLMLGLCHCTGTVAMEELAKRSRTYQSIVTGTVLQFG